MKNLSLISFVGVDLETDFYEIQSLNDSSGIHCEFGILYSESQKNKRYPNYEFCDHFLNWTYDSSVKSSIHLCGSESIEKFLSEDPSIMDLCHLSNRIQLNINIKNFPDYDELSDKILNIVNKRKFTIILQKNATKQKFNELMLKKLNKLNNTNIHFLNDSSGGFGREISKVDEPDVKYFTGYAGGIKPENVSKIVSLIEDKNQNNIKYYIDMESGIRESNNFSIKKCKQILDSLK